MRREMTEAEEKLWSEFSFSGNFARDMTYSIAWALYAFALLLVGMKQKTGWVRYAGVVLLLVTLGKLFLHDLGNSESALSDRRVHRRRHHSHRRLVRLSALPGPEDQGKPAAASAVATALVAVHALRAAAIASHARVAHSGAATAVDISLS